MVLYSAFTDPDLFWRRIASNPGFDPGRSLFYSDPAPSTGRDGGLVGVSGERNFPNGRANALQWFKAWDR